MVAEAKIMCPQNVEVFAKGMSVGEVEDVVASISPKSFDPSRPLEFVSPAAALISTSQPVSCLILKFSSFWIIWSSRC